MAVPAFARSHARRGGRDGWHRWAVCSRSLPYPAVVVVDLVRAYTEPGGPFFLGGEDPETPSRVLEACAALVGAARPAGVPVVWTVGLLSGEKLASHHATVALGSVLGGPDLVRYYLSDHYQQVRNLLTS